MPNRKLYDEILQLEKGFSTYTQDLTSIRKMVGELIETNHALKMENNHLKNRLEELQKLQSTQQVETELDLTENTMSKSLLNLEKIYEQGFHICNYEYGKRRVNDEECIFCTNILYGENQVQHKHSSE